MSKLKQSGYVFNNDGNDVFKLPPLKQIKVIDNKESEMELENLQKKCFKNLPEVKNVSMTQSGFWHNSEKNNNDHSSKKTDDNNGENQYNENDSNRKNSPISNNESNENERSINRENIIIRDRLQRLKSMNVGVKNYNNHFVRNSALLITGKMEFNTTSRESYQPKMVYKQPEIKNCFLIKGGYQQNRSQLKSIITPKL